MKKTYVIGDIHGAYLALKNLLDQVNFDYENDKLICLGDVCDGWSQTPEAIELLLSIKNLVYVQGNHDEWTVMFLTEIPKYSDLYYDQYRSWLHHGGKATFEAYERVPVLKEKHIKFLKEAPYYYIDENNNLYVHAGYQKICLNENGTMKVENSFVKEILLWDRQFWNDMYKGKKLATDFNKVFIGHTPTLNYPNNKGEHLKPILRKNVINMDTGAAFTGKLSMMNIDTEELFQSELRVMEYYPREFGRNQKAFIRY
jgi:serine/threonine protein phosphatase 1